VNVKEIFVKKSLLPLIFILVSCTNQPGENQVNTSIPPVEVTSTAKSGSEDDSIGLVTETITPTSSPNKAQISWSSIGPGGGGRLTSLAFAPLNTIYVGNDVGGVFRSLDGGKTFEIINDGLQNYVVLTIAVHPDYPSTIYLGTAGGLYISLDNGEHWKWSRNGFPSIEQYRWSAPITSLAIDPNNPEIIFAGVGDSLRHRFGQGLIYKSEDSGEHWAIVNTGSTNLHSNAIIYSILVFPQSSNEIIVSTDYGVYKSMDGGINWEPKNIGLPHTNTRKVIMDPTDPTILYLTINSPPNESPWQGGVYKSLDGGNSWQPKTYGLGNHVGSPGDPNLITANYENIIIDPQNPDVLFVGAISWWDAGIYKTTNGAESWTNIISRQNTDWGWINHDDWSPPQGECMLINPDEPEHVFVGDAWQLFETDNGGNTWNQIYTNQIPPDSGTWQGRGIETTVVYDIEVDPTNSNIIYIGYADVGFHKSMDGGITFKRFSQGLNHPENIFDIEIDPDKPNVIYASSGRWEWDSGDVVYSEDFGQTWEVIGNPASGLPDSVVHDLVLDHNSPIDNRILYATSFKNGVYKSENGGGSWVKINHGLDISGNRHVSSLVIDPTDSNVLYAGVAMEGGSSGLQYGGVYKTEDGGLSWNKVDNIIRNVMDISIDPRNPKTIFAATRQDSGGVYRSTDGGSKWELVFKDPYVMKVVIEPHNPGVVYAGTGDHPYHDQSTGNGLFRSDDSGQSWYSVNEGLANLSIWDLVINPTDPAILYLGTGGNGVFKGSIQE
jgi:photosystem II stability/assembly factor-like uncharacterized protein